MHEGQFKKLELEEVAAVLERLNPHFDGIVFDPVETTILASDLSFYPGCRLLSIADYSMQPPLQRFVVYGAEKYFIVTFSNDPIYAFNQRCPIVLDKDNVTDYVRFFFRYVRGRHGRFLVSESLEDINWRDDPPPAARKTIGEMIQPLFLEKTDEAGVYYIRACMVFKDSLFKTLVKVEPNGFVSLSDEELLIEDMPVLDDTFGQ